jgi:hypothetical protein
VGGGVGSGELLLSDFWIRERQRQPLEDRLKNYTRARWGEGNDGEGRGRLWPPAAAAARGRRRTGSRGMGAGVSVGLELPARRSRTWQEEAERGG